MLQTRARGQKIGEKTASSRDARTLAAIYSSAAPRAASREGKRKGNDRKQHGKARKVVDTARTRWGEARRHKGKE
eukprot:6183101-Pleurochrysis_carterae.AAC.1